jgi:flagellar motor switch protein FliN
MCHFRVASVDQLTFNDFLRSIPTPTCLPIINFDPLKGNILTEISPDITFAIINRIFGGLPEYVKRQHELTDIEISIMEGLMLRLLGNLREAWSYVLDLRPRLGQIDTNPQFAQIVPPNEMTVLVMIEAKIEEVEGSFFICYPYSTIEEIIPRLDPRHWYGVKEKETASVKLENVKLDNINITLRAELLHAELTYKELKELKVNSQFFAKKTFNLIADNITIGKFQENGKTITITGLNTKEKYFMKENVCYKEGQLDDVKIQIIYELGRANCSISEVKEFKEGTILELDKLTGDPVDIFANNVLIGTGEVLAIEEKFGIRITHINGDEHSDTCQGNEEAKGVN